MSLYPLHMSIKKMIHYAVNIMSTEAKLFAIRCGINKAVQSTLININQQPYQKNSGNSSNSIDFWDYPSNNKILDKLSIVIC